VRTYFASRGVTLDRVEIVSAGKERPLCESQDESCWAQNRRVEFEITGGGATITKPH
jgi:peptidoglycan-associated lipoprotein